jgi:hypothetical protein
MSRVEHCDLPVVGRGEAAFCAPIDSASNSKRRPDTVRWLAVVAAIPLASCQATGVLNPQGPIASAQEQLPSLGERYCGPLATVQQANAKRLLQLLDLQADGGLRHVQPVSGAREAELFGDGYEIAKLANVEHVPI